MGRVRIKLDERQLRVLTGQAAGEVRDAFDEAAQAIVNRAQDELQGRGSIPTTVDTGALVRSVDVLSVDESAGGLRARIGSLLPYAGIIHEGRGEVTPRRAGGVLRWPNRGGGPRAFVFATSSGPVAARPFMVLALEEAERDIRRAFDA